MPIYPWSLRELLLAHEAPQPIPAAPEFGGYAAWAKAIVDELPLSYTALELAALTLLDFIAEVLWALGREYEATEITSHLLPVEQYVQKEFTFGQYPLRDRLRDVADHWYEQAIGYEQPVHEWEEGDVEIPPEDLGVSYLMDAAAEALMVIVEGPYVSIMKEPADKAWVLQGALEPFLDGVAVDFGPEVAVDVAQIWWDRVWSRLAALNIESELQD